MNSYKLSCVSYSRDFERPLYLARGVIAAREGVLVRLEGENGEVGFGEAIVMPHFDSLNLTSCLEQISEIGSRITRAVIESLPSSIVRFALESALLMVEGHPLYDVGFSSPRPVSHLLPAGASSVSALEHGLAQGYSVFKWKIGVEDFAVESTLLKSLLERLPSGAKMRLDANASLSEEVAKSWLAACEGEAVEYIEQPLAAHLIDETIQLAKSFEVAIALDESIATLESIEKVWACGWRGIYSIKPLRLGTLEAFLRWRDAHRDAEIVYASALETLVGTELALRLAASDPCNNRALGFGVGHWFKDDGLCPSLAPSVESIPRVAIEELRARGF